MFFSCGSNNFQISSSSKRIKYPGIPSGKSFVEYTIAFKSEKEFVIDGIKLNNQKSVDFSLFSSELKNYVKSAENNSKGSYILSFKTSSIKEIDNEDYVMLNLKFDDEIKKQKIPVVKIEAFRGR